MAFPCPSIHAPPAGPPKTLRWRSALLRSSLRAHLFVVDQACGQFPSKYGAFPSNPCPFTSLRTLFRNGALPTAFSSSACALFPMQRRVVPLHSPNSVSLKPELATRSKDTFLLSITGHGTRTTDHGSVAQVVRMGSRRQPTWSKGAATQRVGRTTASGLR